MGFRPNIRTAVSGGILAAASAVAGVDRPLPLPPLTVHGEAREADGSGEPVSVTRLGREAQGPGTGVALPELTAPAPNFSLLDSGSRSVSDVISVRGLANTPVFGVPSMALYVDDVPYGNTFTFASRFYALDSVAVYRGPQGTRVGRNAYAGLVEVRTRYPGNEVHGRVAAETGNFGQRAVAGWIGGALVEDSLAASLAGGFSRRGGVLRNTFLGVRPDERKAFGGRGKLLWTPAAGWKITLLGDVQEFADGAPRIVPLGAGRKVASQTAGKNRQHVQTAAVRVQHRGDGFRFLSVSAFRRWRQDPLAIDLDLTPDPIADLRQRRRERQWSQELRIQSVPGSRPWDWRAGVFTALVRDERRVALGFPGTREDSVNRLRQQNYAAFTELGYHGFGRLGLRLGLRLDHVRQRFVRARRGGPSGPVPAALESQQHRFTFVSPKFSLDFGFTPAWVAYGSTALAFRPGGFASTDLAVFAGFDRERLWANEIGLHGVVWKDRLAVDLRLFYYRIRDYQVERFFSPAELFVVNAPEAVSRGGEVELVATPAAWLELESRFGFTATRFERFRDPVSGVDLAGNAAPFVPRYNFLCRVTLHPLARASLRLELVGRGETFFDDLNRGLLREPAYTLVNLQGEYALSGFSVYAFVTNLTDVNYFTQRIPSPPVGAPGLPRMAGVGLKFSY